MFCSPPISARIQHALSTRLPKMLGLLTISRRWCTQRRRKRHAPSNKPWWYSGSQPTRFLSPDRFCNSRHPHQTARATIRNLGSWEMRFFMLTYHCFEVVASKLMLPTLASRYECSLHTLVTPMKPGHHMTFAVPSLLGLVLFPWDDSLGLSRARALCGPLLRAPGTLACVAFLSWSHKSHIDATSLTGLCPLRRRV